MIPMPTLTNPIAEWLEARRNAQAQRAAAALRADVENAYDRVGAAIRRHQHDFLNDVADEQCLTALRRALQTKGQAGLAAAVTEMREKFYTDVETRAGVEVMRVGLGSRFEPNETEKQRWRTHAHLVTDIVRTWGREILGTASRDSATGIAAIHALLNAAPVPSAYGLPPTLEAVSRILEDPGGPDAQALHNWKGWVAHGLMFHEGFEQWRQQPDGWVRHAAGLGLDAQETLARAGQLSPERFAPHRRAPKR